nr:uncharacterized protein LOC129527076 [Gorilla gorilla gorilla]
MEHICCRSRRCYRISRKRGAVAVGGPLPAGRKVVSSSEPQRPCRVLESVWPGFQGSPHAGGLLRMGQLPWEVRCLLSRKMVHASEKQALRVPRFGVAWHPRCTPCWRVAQDGAVALRGPPPAGMTDGQFFRAVESPWSRGVGVASHPQCTPCWWMAQDAAVVMRGLPLAGKEDGQFF